MAVVTTDILDCSRPVPSPQKPTCQNSSLSLSVKPGQAYPQDAINEFIIRKLNPLVLVMSREFTLEAVSKGNKGNKGNRRTGRKRGTEEQDEQGEQGNKGNKGNKGNRGTIGTGKQGQPGKQGEQGEQEEQGKQGKGQQRSKGSRGNKRNKGNGGKGQERNKGNRGTKGTGKQGEQGNNGTREQENSGNKGTGELKREDQRGSTCTFTCIVTFHTLPRFFLRTSILRTNARKKYATLEIYPRSVTLRFQKQLRWRLVRCYEPFTMLTLYHLPIVVKVSKANWRPSTKSQVGPLLSALQDNFVKLSKSDGVILYLFSISLFRSCRSSCFLFDSLSALGRSTAENIRAPVTAANINAITHDKVFFCKEFMSDNQCQCKEDV